MMVLRMVFLELQTQAAVAAAAVVVVLRLEVRVVQVLCLFLTPAHNERKAAQSQVIRLVGLHTQSTPSPHPVHLRHKERT
jgi:hypothetical protein